MATLAAIRKRFRFDAGRQQYRGPNGRYVPNDALAKSLRRYAANATKALQRITARMTAGEINIPEWQLQMADRVKSLHLAQAVAARGGWERMTQSDYGRLGAQLRWHYSRLQDFAVKVERGELSDAQAVARSTLFGNAGNLTYQNERRNSATAVFTEERRVLGRAEHCPDCVKAAAKGWQAIGTLPPIGQSLCRSNCKCRFIFRK